MPIQNDPFAPRFKLTVNGAELSDRLHSLIRKVEFEDESEFASSMSYQLSYRQDKIGGTDEGILYSKLISPGNLIVLKGGYGTDLVDIGAAFVTDLEPDFSANGEPVLNIIGYDRLHLLSLRKSEKGEKFEKYRDSQIASILGERNGFAISTTDSDSYAGIRKTKEIKVRQQKRGSSDLDFLKELAKFNAYDLYCKWNKDQKRFSLFFEPSKDRTKEVMTFKYNDDNAPFNVQNVNGKLLAKLLSFKPRMSVLNQFTKYKVFAWDRKMERKISYTMSMDEFLPELGNIKLGGVDAGDDVDDKSTQSGATIRNQTFGEMVEIISTKDFENEKDAKDYLAMHMKKLAKDFINGSAEINGCQYLQSRQIHNFEGLGPYFSGKYFMKKVKHVFNDKGYKCKLDVRKAIKEQQKYV